MACFILSPSAPPDLNRALRLARFDPMETAAAIWFIDFFSFGSFMKAIAMTGIRLSVKKAEAVENRSTVSPEKSTAGSTTGVIIRYTFKSR